MRIFFVGNSFTYRHNLPELVAGLSASLSPSHPVETEMFAQVAALLSSLWQSGVPSSTLSRSQWDYVVLQEQSTLGHGLEKDGIPQVRSPEAFHESVRKIVPQIRESGAEPLLYLTWSRRDTPAAQSRLNSAYQDIGAELGVKVAPVGVAFHRVLARYPELDLYDSDGFHPSPMGSYLAACVFYATIFGRSPEGAAARIMGSIVDDGVAQDRRGVLAELTTEDASFLQRIAWRTVNE